MEFFLKKIAKLSLFIVSLFLIKFLIIKSIKIKDINESDLVIVSDYNKGFLTEEVLVQIGKLSKLSIIDTKKTISKDLIDSFTFIKLNEHEYERNKNISDKNLNPPKSF